MDPALGENSNANPKCFALNPSTSIKLIQTNIFPLFSGSCWPVLFLFFLTLCISLTILRIPIFIPLHQDGFYSQTAYCFTNIHSFTFLTGRME